MTGSLFHDKTPNAYFIMGICQVTVNDATRDRLILYQRFHSFVDLSHSLLFVHVKSALPRNLHA